MEVLDYGTRYVFTKDYITEYREYKEGTVCNIINNIVVLGRNGEFLFDIDSNLGRRYGKVIE